VIKNVQFINYGSNAVKLYEYEDQESSSKANKHEAGFVAALVKYFLLNGVNEEKITILTFYLRQVQEIKCFLRYMEGQPQINCQTVDNFQGQENDIIILSTVRSNRAGRGGFSVIDNRVCVALSRARNSLFVVGNLEMLAKSPVPRSNAQSEGNIWARILKCAKTRDTLVTGVALYCVRHAPYKRYIQPGKTPDDTAKMFQKYFPEGGCTKPCEIRLNCGHRCPHAICTCHHADRHKSLKCQQKCERLCPLGGHKSCKLRCWQACEMCPILVAKTVPKCGHSQVGCIGPISCII